MPLRIIVVGAGIGGLTTAVALRQAGHHVQVFEKSRFTGEFGAALLVTPNAERVLSRLGFSFPRARGMQMTCWEMLDGTTLDPIARVDLSNAQEQFGARLYTMHRVDLHNELMRLATDPVQDLPQIKLHLGAKVVTARPEEGLIQLENGTRHEADLIVAADGLHSVLKSIVVGTEAPAPRPAGLSAFRFQIPTARLANDEKFIELLKNKGRGSTVLADTKETKSERHLVWYDCQDGLIQNFVGIHETYRKGTENLKVSMLSEFEHFHPSIRHIINMAGDVTDWPLYVYDPIPTWQRDKLVMIGDAAHPMLPLGGQGANQAIEDAAAIGCIFEGVKSAERVPNGLAMFEKVRHLRACRVQTLSKVRLGKEINVKEELEKYADPPGSAVPTSFPERYQHDFGFDVFDKCREVLQLGG